MERGVTADEAVAGVVSYTNTAVLPDCEYVDDHGVCFCSRPVVCVLHGWLTCYGTLLVSA